RITLGGLIACGDLVVKNLQLLEQYRGLNGIEPCSEADADIVVFIGALPMHADAAQPLGERGIVGKDGAAVAIAAERLCGEEAGRGGAAEGAEAAALVAGAKALRGVIEHEQALGFGHRRYRVVIGALSE